MDLYEGGWVGADSPPNPGICSIARPSTHQCTVHYLTYYDHVLAVSSFFFFFFFFSPMIEGVFLCEKKYFCLT
jgi:hypothetical protein